MGVIFSGNGKGKGKALAVTSGMGKALVLAAALLVRPPCAAADPSACGPVREYPVMREDPSGRLPDVFAGIPAAADSAFGSIPRKWRGAPAETSASGHFLRVAEGKGHGLKVIYDGREIEWDRNRHGGALPILLEDGLLSVEWAREPLAGDDTVEYLVKKGESVEYRFRAHDPVDYPVRAFFMHKGKWHLQVKDRLIVAGEDWNRRSGMGSIFNVREFGGRTAWFAVRRGERRAYLYRGGVRTGKGYDRVLHDLCCGSAVLNIVNGRDEIGFFGLRAGTWYFVVVRA